MEYYFLKKDRQKKDSKKNCQEVSVSGRQGLAGNQASEVMAAVRSLSSLQPPQLLFQDSPAPLSVVVLLVALSLHLSSQAGSQHHLRESVLSVYRLDFRLLKKSKAQSPYNVQCIPNLSCVLWVW